jgi:hypothetical protein
MTTAAFFIFLHPLFRQFLFILPFLSALAMLVLLMPFLGSPALSTMTPVSAHHDKVQSDKDNDEDDRRICCKVCLVHDDEVRCHNDQKSDEEVSVDPRPLEPSFDPAHISAAATHYNHSFRIIS